MAPSSLLYEVNTRCHLRSLSDRIGRKASLLDISDSELARWSSWGFTHVWLMGVWPTGPLVRQHAFRQPSLRTRFNEYLPGWQKKDVLGSPYGIAAYQPDDLIGGETALLKFRDRLHALGMKLILDFIPNHVGLDHPWVNERPDLLVTSPRQYPGHFPVEHNGRDLWVAHGKDPYFHPWTDTAQLDLRNNSTRRALIKELLQIASWCDGVRCDMAMLVLNEIFSNTWRNHPSDTIPPKTEFWTEAISAVKRSHPDFLFMAEVYWGREAQLQSLGFDYTYDKGFLDHITGLRTAELQYHLQHHRNSLNHDVRFLENHDEARVACQLPEAPRQHAAALLWLALPGMKLLYEGQMEGWKAQIPVQLSRWPEEMPDQATFDYYGKILTFRKETALRDGTCHIAAALPAWTGNPSHQNLFVICWQKEESAFELIVVNYAPHASQCYARLDASFSASSQWVMRNRLGDETYVQSREDLMTRGLYLDLPTWGAHWFAVTAES